MDNPKGMRRQLIQAGDRPNLIARSNHNAKCFTEEQIKGMTDNYKTILGRGAFGEVYAGVLEDTSRVAVKRFIHNVKENFAQELTVHREINHKNVVRLIGYCIDENALMLVTEYIPKGNLSVVLHQDNIPITLDTRLRIAIECAEALRYMHTEMYTQVIHGDIKPANILLDDSFSAKLSDFGISRLVNTENTLYTQNVIGSIGYMDPLFAQSGRLTAKSDVYSFGVVLLELITRKKAGRDDGKMSLVECFAQARAEGARRVKEMFDAEIAIPSDMMTIVQIAKLASKCLMMELDKRPKMSEVAAHLRILREAMHQGRDRAALFSWGSGSRTVRRRIAMARRGQAHQSLVIKPGARFAPEVKAASGVDSRATPPYTLSANLTASGELIDEFHGINRLPLESLPEVAAMENRAQADAAAAHSRPRLPMVPAKTPWQGRTPSQYRSSNGENAGIVSFGSTETAALELDVKDRHEAIVVLGRGNASAWTTYKAKLLSGATLVFKRPCCYFCCRHRRVLIACLTCLTFLFLLFLFLLESCVSRRIESCRLRFTQKFTA